MQIKIQIQDVFGLEGAPPLTYMYCPHTQLYTLVLFRSGISPPTQAGQKGGNGAERGRGGHGEVRGKEVGG